ncbi:MAG TPA: ABC transporter substrate-binding protein [Ktedonobacterales bacterium]|nr:ABC transporter substrate-binding protein [Ktedonobacterales bacterium]
MGVGNTFASNRRDGDDTQSGRAARGSHSRSRRRGSGALKLLIAVVGLLPLALASCSFGGATAGSSLATNQTFTWPYNGATKIGYGEVLDPATLTDLKDIGTTSMIYTNLVTFKGSGNNLNVVGDAATRWEVDNTGTSYTFHLRPNLRFSDGTQITASDFAYSMQRALNPNLCTALDAATYGQPNPNGNANIGVCAGGAGGNLAVTYLGHILGAMNYNNTGQGTIIGTTAASGLEVIDTQTLRINLDKPIRYFLDALTYPTADVLEKSLLENSAYAGGKWVDHLDLGGCSGPFKIASYGNGSEMTLVPNPYWPSAFGQKLTLTKVVRPFVQSPDTEYANYRTGLYDYTDVPANDYIFASGQADFHQIPILSIQYFGLNFTLAPFDNTVIRQAFDLALNKQLLVDRIENGGGIPTNHIVPDGMPGYDPNLLNPPPDSTQSLTGNQPQALSLLQSAQKTCSAAINAAQPPDYCPYIATSNPQPIELWVNADTAVTVALATAAAQAWSNALGLNVQVHKVATFNDLVGTILTKPVVAQMWIISWVADYPDPQDWLTNQFVLTDLYDEGSVNLPSVSQTMLQADVNPDPTSRMQQYNDAEQQLVNAVAWLPFQQNKAYWRIRPWVRGFTFNSLLNVEDISWPNVYIISH